VFVLLERISAGTVNATLRSGDRRGGYWRERVNLRQGLAAAGEACHCVHSDAADDSCSIHGPISSVAPASTHGRHARSSGREIFAGRKPRRAPRSLQTPHCSRRRSDTGTLMVEMVSHP